MSGIDSKERMQMLEAMLTVIAQYGYQDAKTAREFFHHAQSIGFHVLPDHFYSPIPNTAHLAEQVYATDAVFYHSMIRMVQPRQVLEIGA